MPAHFFVQLNSFIKAFVKSFIFLACYSALNCIFKNLPRIRDRYFVEKRMVPKAERSIRLKIKCYAFSSAKTFLSLFEMTYLMSCF